MLDQYSVAFYGEDALLGGLKDCRFDIQFELNCWKGSEFNKNINEYVTRDVIVIGGDNSFGNSVGASKNMAIIKGAVYDRGAILLTNFWSYCSLPQDMLPVTSLGNYGSYGTKLLLTDDLQRIYKVSEDAFIHNGTQLNRGSHKAKKGST